jgi:hypothetical protein
VNTSLMPDGPTLPFRASQVDMWQPMLVDLEPRLSGTRQGDTTVEVATGLQAYANTKQKGGPGSLGNSPRGSVVGLANLPGLGRWIARDRPMELAWPPQRFRRESQTARGATTTITPIDHSTVASFGMLDRRGSGRHRRQATSDWRRARTGGRSCGLGSTGESCRPSRRANRSTFFLVMRRRRVGEFLGSLASEGSWRAVMRQRRTRPYGCAPQRREAARAASASSAPATTNSAVTSSCCFWVAMRSGRFANTLVSCEASLAV